MDASIKLAVQIVFGLATISFVVYSIIAIYSLNTYGLSKQVSSTATVVYTAAMAGILVWGLIALTAF